MGDQMTRLGGLVLILLFVFGNGIGMEGKEVSVNWESAKVERGRSAVAQLERRSLLPKGSCWSRALDELQVNCKQMDLDESLQSRLAFLFTTCYNEIHGFSTVVCPTSVPLTECMVKLSPVDQATFREFFLHTQDMCYFLEYQNWQERTAAAVNTVSTAIVDVSRNLVETRVKQEEVLEKQKESIRVQENIIKDNSQIQGMVKNVKDSMDDVRAAAAEHMTIVEEVYDRITRMHKLISWIQGEMSMLDMLGFYFGFMIFGLFATSTKRTQNARVWITFLMMLTVVGERYLVKLLNGIEENPEAVQEYVWILRQGSALIGCIVLAVIAGSYKDPIAIQRDSVAIMMEMRNEIQGLRSTIDILQDADYEPSSEEESEAEASEDDATTEAVDTDSDGELLDLDQENFPPRHPNGTISYETFYEQKKRAKQQRATQAGVARTIRDVSRAATPVLDFGFNNTQPQQQQPSTSSSAAQRTALAATQQGYNLRRRSAVNYSKDIGNNETVESFQKSIRLGNPASTSRNYYSSDDDA